SRFPSEKIITLLLCPSGSVTIIGRKEVAESEIEKEISQQMIQAFPKNIADVRVALKEEARNDFLFFNYTHGLSNYPGDCQRLFHGHSSKVIIFSDGKRDKGLEKYLSDQIFKPSSHIANSKQLIKQKVIAGKKYVVIGYSASYGRFEALIPEESVLFMDQPATIENIAAFLSKTLTTAFPQYGSIRVVAYEGLNKGSIYTVG
ncbi:MAG TPA: 6-carboxytetrahydropterin synthase, partial [Bacteroidales bacterium]|nr:6-carboxytetrahydropterin synthase [Bacteroidales bacterium]